MERLELFFMANDILDIPGNMQKRQAILLSMIGSKTNRLVWDLVAAERPTNKSYSEILEDLRNHFQPKSD